MGAIKDIMDLTIKLLESKEARKFATEIIKIQTLVASIQSENSSLVEKNTQLQHENLELKHQLMQIEDAHAKELSVLSKKHSLRFQVKLHENVYVPANAEIPGYGKGPWCTKCFDSSGKLITLHHKMAGGINDIIWYKWECPNCKSSVSAPNK